MWWTVLMSLIVAVNQSLGQNSAQSCACDCSQCFENREQVLAAAINYKNPIAPKEAKNVTSKPTDQSADTPVLTARSKSTASRTPVQSSVIEQEDFESLLDDVIQTLLKSLTVESRALREQGVTDERLRRARLQNCAVSTVKQVSQDIRKLGKLAPDPDPVVRTITEAVRKSPELRKLEEVDSKVAVRSQPTPNGGLSPVTTDFIKLIMSAESI